MPKPIPNGKPVGLFLAHGLVGAFANLDKVCRTGTHLFHFAEYMNAMRGWGRGLRHAVGHWYADRGADDLAHQFALQSTDSR